jgi:hypothetical protein
MANQPPVRLYALRFDELWDKLTSDALNFESVFDVKKKSVGVVEFRHLLTTSRSAALDASVHDGNPAFVMERFVHIRTRSLFLYIDLHGSIVPCS